MIKRLNWIESESIYKLDLPSETVRNWKVFLSFNQCQWGKDCIPWLSGNTPGVLSLRVPLRPASNQILSVYRPCFLWRAAFRGAIMLMNHWSPPISSMRSCDHKLLSPKSRSSGAPLAEVNVKVPCSSNYLKILRHLPSNASTWLLVDGSNQDPAICGQRFDPKWPFFGTYVRKNFCHLCPHHDQTSGFLVVSVRMRYQTYFLVEYIRMADQT